MGFFRDLYNAYIFNNYTAPFLSSLNAMSLELERIQQQNEEAAENQNRKTRRKNKRKKRNK